MSYQHPIAPHGATRRYTRRVIRIDYADPGYRSGGLFGTTEQTIVAWTDLQNGLAVFDVLKYERWLGTLSTPPGPDQPITALAAGAAGHDTLRPPHAERNPMTTIATALEAVENARADLNKTLAEVADDFRTHLGTALDAMVKRTVIEQPTITTEKLDAADRTVLKENLKQARESALQSVSVRLSELDLDALASTAEMNMSGGTFIQYREILSPLLRVTGDLLANAGYSTDAFLHGRLGRGYDIGNIIGVGSVGSVAARRLDTAIEKYGQALITLDQAETAHAQAVARELWDQAD